MKITFVINGYKQENDLLERERLCLSSLRKLKHKHAVSLLNVNNNRVMYEHFDTCHMSHDGKYPLMNRIMTTACDYVKTGVVIFVNLDIYVMSNMLDRVDMFHDTWFASRMDVIPEGSDTLEFRPVEYSVHGFDLFGVTTSWWSQHSHLFPDMYLGRPYWDTLYYVICMEHSKCRTINDHPACIYHLKHPNQWENSTDEYKTHNEQQLNNVKSFSKWWKYVYGVLLKRSEKDGVKYWTPLVNESDIAHEIFKS